jgi:alpha-L-fucosidase
MRNCRGLKMRNYLSEMKLLFLSLFFVSVVNAQLPVPTKSQLEWQQCETNAFLHFTVNTFTGKEWGDGTEDPAIFNPTSFNADSVVAPLKKAGFKIVILTAKHHDGFCLWPSKFTAHSVASSTWKNGNGDVVKDIAAACKRYGLEFGFYLSPWDRHEPSYGTAAYNDFYKNQLRELLTNYGDIAEVWFDGAKGENAKDMQYDFAGYWKLVRELQPNAIMFSDAGPDVRWVGNEKGNAGETCWSTIDTTGMAPGKADENYLNTGDANGKYFIPAETDVSIRPGWFYHAEEDSKVKSGAALVDLYYKSAGRNSLLLLNIPPTKDGLLHPKDIESIYEFRSILNETFSNDLSKNKTGKKLSDRSLNSFITMKNNVPFVIDLHEKKSFDRLLLQENIAQGQRNRKMRIEYLSAGEWKILADITTIGYKRLLRFDAVKTNKIRLTVLESKSAVLLSEVGIYKASAREGN